MRLIVGDTSCFILFTKIDELSILGNTFRSILVTDKVVEEFGLIPDWVVVRTDYDENTYQKLSQNLGAGESSCIALAQQLADPVLIIDDRKARTIAEGVGVECIGSLGILLVAKREGVIDSVAPILQKVRATNFRASEKIFQLVLEMAGEG